MVKNSRSGFSNVHVFPNPSSDFIRVETKSMQNEKDFVAVTNAAGGIVKSGQYNFVSQGNLKINISKLPPGKYFLKTNIGQEVNTTGFIKN